VKSFWSYTSKLPNNVNWTNKGLIGSNTTRSSILNNLRKTKAVYLEAFAKTLKHSFINERNVCMNLQKHFRSKFVGRHLGPNGGFPQKLPNPWQKWLSKTLSLTSSIQRFGKGFMIDDMQLELHKSIIDLSLQLNAKTSPGKCIFSVANRLLIYC